MREVRDGVWHWEARHPEWREGQWWGPLVSSYAIDEGKRLLLFDPVGPPAEIEKLAEEREAAIVLTCPWHRRDAQTLATRYGAALYEAPPDEGDPSPVDGTVFRAGDRLPVDVEAFAGMWSRTTSCSGSRATVRSSPATRSGRESGARARASSLVQSRPGIAAQLPKRQAIAARTCGRYLAPWKRPRMSGSLLASCS